MPKKVSDTEMIAAFIIVCMILIGLYISSTIESDVQRDIDDAITLDASN